MTDIRIVNHASLEGIWTDWLLTPDSQLDESEHLANIVTMALLTDSLADADDVLPDPDSIDRKGWWGDLDYQIWNGWPVGCKLWLLSRAKITGIAAKEGATVARVEQYIYAALLPLVQKKMCSHIDVKAWRYEKERIYARVMVYRGPKKDIELEFQGMFSTNGEG